MRALRYLHGRNITHADVKLENCLFGSESLDSLHLVDFGLSVNIKDFQDVSEGSRGTLNYMAPELFFIDRSKPILAQLWPQVDVWAAGVILYTLSCGFLPFNGTTPEQVVSQMRLPEEFIHQRLSSCRQWALLNPLLQDLILNMLRVNPQSRLTSSQVLKHPWMIDVRNQNYAQKQMFVNVNDLKTVAIYGKTHTLKKLILMFSAVRLTDASCETIKRKFEAADRDQNG